MPQSDLDDSFDNWHRSLVAPGDIDDDGLAEAVRRWMRALYGAEGSLSREDAEAAYRRHMIQLARLDVEVVRRTSNGRLAGCQR